MESQVGVGPAQLLGGVPCSPVTGALGPTALHLGLVIAVGSGLALLPWRWALGPRPGPFLS